jgi:CRISPR-associated protein Cas1
MDVQLNTLYVVTRGATVQRDHLTLQVSVAKVVRLTVPIHQLESVALFGMTHVTPGAMQLCAEQGVAITFMTESGRLISRVDAPGSGNVLLRRTQFRWADQPERIAGIARCIVAGKVQNARSLLLRAAREADVPADIAILQQAVAHLAEVIPRLLDLNDVDAIRGHEGDAARVYFEAFPALVRQNRDGFRFTTRSRRPPLDPINALLSFVYALLLADCMSAAAVAGLDPSVGFLHVDRPGRPGLALDLMEEFRSLLADRLVLALVNRQQLKPDQFTTQEGGAVRMTDEARRTVVAAYQQRKRDEITHPLLNQKTTLGRLPFLQARILARHLRGDLPSYLPCVLKN